MIIQWDPPKTLIQKKFIDLGVTKVCPEDYIVKFGSTLKTYDELPDFVKEIQAPANLRLASQVRANVSRLEGDLDALGLIDLDKEGLSEYRIFLGKSSNTTSFAPYSGLDFPTNDINELMFEQVLSVVQPQNKNTLTLNEARVIIAMMNEKQGKKYNDAQAEIFLSELCPNREEWVDLNAFKIALFKDLFYK